MFNRLKSLFLKTRKIKLTEIALFEQKNDRKGLLHSQDPDKTEVINATVSWLNRAQDCSASNDGGVARDYSLINGWATSYPETTGYIIPTFIELAKRTGNEAMHKRARRMLNWCVNIQFPEGGFQGGMIGSTPRVPVTFNTGQILLGLCAGVNEYGYLNLIDAMNKAAVWLRDSQDGDGCWRKRPTPFAAPGEKAYETHVAWGLLEAERVAPNNGYGEAGLRQINWALTKQSSNGWFSSNCLTNPRAPLTHTIGYVLRGLIEGYLYSHRPVLLTAARRTADGILSAIETDGRLPGRLNSKWKGEVSFVCLTGSVQIAHCLFLLYQETGDKRYLEHGKKLNAFVRRTVRLDGPEYMRGGIKGSFPIDGDYGQWQYLNWAAKFFIDANLLEMEILGERYA